jgi:hypothetical protein
MPPKNYQNFTVRKEVYDILKKDYEDQPKEWLVRHGISSFNGYVMYRLNELAEETLKRKQKQSNP